MSNENKIIDSDRCIGCVHYIFDLTCTAFPKRIPDDILSGVNDHSKPYPGQGNDIVFIKKPEQKKNKNERLKKKGSR